jgi:hypothetical protein
MAAHINQVPAWWLGMANTRDAWQLLALLDEVKRLGISRNDVAALSGSGGRCRSTGSCAISRQRSEKAQAAHEAGAVV